MKHFYKDPQAAAWMGSKFGMRFLDSDGQELEFDEVMLLFFQPDDPTDDQPEWDGTHFIHPDSLHLLEPQVGDLCEFDKGSFARIERLTEHHRNRKIIQRNCIAFMWPESGAV